MNQLTLDKFIEALQAVSAHGHGDMLVAFSKDPEGNGFCFVGASGLFGFGKVDEVWGQSETIAVGTPVVILWPGYPQFEASFDEDDDE